LIWAGASVFQVKCLASPGYVHMYGAITISSLNARRFPTGLESSIKRQPVATTCVCLFTSLNSTLRLKMSVNSVLDTTLASIVASSPTLRLLRDLHTQALAEPPFISTAQPTSTALDKFVALDPDKCALVYLLLRSTGARFVVEAGTSFGVSTIYLALAVGQNASLQNSAGKVIATENEPTKASRARDHWKAAGSEVETWIELREGDLRETLRTDLPEQVDFLLLDSESTAGLTGKL
jgi:hypothetical protein